MIRVMQAFVGSEKILKQQTQKISAQHFATRNFSYLFYFGINFCFKQMDAEKPQTAGV